MKQDSFLINPLPHDPDFERGYGRSSLTPSFKIENVGNQPFHLFPQCFLSYQRKIAPLNPFPNKPWFLRVCSTSLLKTWWEKKKLLVRSNFFFSHCVLYPFRELFTIFIKFEIVVCKLFEFGRV